MVDFDKLLGRIYEAGAVPDMWPDALLAVSDLVGAQGAMLFTARADRASWLASPGFSEDMDAYFNGHHAENERTRRLMALQHPGFVTDLDVFIPDEIDQQKVYQDFWFPRATAGAWRLSFRSRAATRSSITPNVCRRTDRSRRRSSIRSIGCDRILPARRCCQRGLTCSGFKR